MNRNNQQQHHKPVNEQPDKKPVKRWLDTKEVCRMLNASPRTLRYWRDKEGLLYSQVGKGKIYFDINDIDEFLEKRKVKK
jgi:UPF0288 family protein (methanogenesis marker protein 3)